MQLDNDAIAEFKKLYFQEYGIQLTDSQAVDYGSRLIKFVKVIYGKDLPLTPVDREDVKSDNYNELK